MLRPLWISVEPGKAWAEVRSLNLLTRTETSVGGSQLEALVTSKEMETVSVVSVLPDFNRTCTCRVWDPMLKSVVEYGSADELMPPAKSQGLLLSVDTMDPSMEKMTCFKAPS